MSEPQRTPTALVLSVALGATGVLLFLVGALIGGDAVFVAGAAAGGLSLGAALYWRSELISAWKQDRRRP
ncbi:MAG: hypothetical protein M3378_09985 [Actinomycetota bacterium]|nr:hypothetical protein [Actinomycetota bacterium]MDQ3680849.1 hypothetical protein [Actinomycetota bacterium]